MMERKEGETPLPIKRPSRPSNHKSKIRVHTIPYMHSSSHIITFVRSVQSDPSG